MSRQLSTDDRQRVQAMTAAVARANTMPERIKEELRNGPATREELQAILYGDMGEGKRQIIKGALRRLRIAGEIREVPMQRWSGRRAQIAEVLVWELVETKGEVAA